MEYSSIGKRLVVKRSNCGSCIAQVRGDKGKSLGNYKGNDAGPGERMSRHEIQPKLSTTELLLHFQRAPMATGSTLTLSWNQSHSNYHLLA